MVFLLVFVPLIYWSGTWDPALIKDWLFPNPDPLIGVLSGLMGTLLILLPLCWIVISGRLDVAALALAQNGLIFFGYFFLQETAARQGAIGYDTERFAGMLVLLNVFGFVILFSVMAFVYMVERVRGVDYGHWPQNVDNSLQWLLRVAGTGCAIVLVLPMAQSGVIPLFAADSTQARFDIVESSWVRPLYHMGSALLPLVVAGIVVWIIRKPRRLFGWDGLMCLVMTTAQLLTSNRLPLALTLVATLALISMEFKLPRVIFFLVFLSYIAAFTFLSGLTSLWREREVELKPDLIQRSVRQAFIGDNIIDLRDGSWVLSKWDFKPLAGKTYLGGMVAFMPSGLFPQKKDWHLGMNAVRIIGWEDKEHFGLRLTFFAEAFLNFGLAGVGVLATLMGVIFGRLLFRIHHTPAPDGANLTIHLGLVAALQMAMPLANTSDAFIAWSMAGFMFAMWFFILRPAQRAMKAH